MRVTINSFLGMSLLLAGLSACSESKPDKPHLLGSPDKDTSAEAERLRNMQLVRVVDDDTNEIVELSPEEFAGAIVQCGFAEQCDAGAASLCDGAACVLGREQCIADHLLAVASGTGSAVKYTLDRPGFLTFEARVPPQSAASSAAIAIEASKLYEKAVADAYRILNHMSECVNIAESTPYTQGIRIQAFATTNYINAFEGGKRAYRTAFKHTLAVSDAELSSSNQLDVARIRAIAKEDLSRTAAAHLMVGGRPGWFGSTNEAFCTSSKLTGPQQAALAIFREAAPNPSSVLAELGVPTDLLVNGGPGTVLDGSLRERLTDLWGTGAIPANKTLWEAYGLTLADFEAARKALRDEIMIFGRNGFDSPALTLEPRARAGNRTPLYDQFAGTAGKPPDRPDQYWMLLALLDAPENAEQKGFWRPWEQNREEFIDEFSQPITGADNLAGFVDRAYSWARFLSEGDPSDEQLNTDVVNPMKLFLSGNDIRARLSHCSHKLETDLAANSQEIRIHGFEAADQLVLVRREELMDCAVNGHVEGARCVLPNLLQDPPPEQQADIIRFTVQDFSSTGRFQTLVKHTFEGEFPGITGRYYLIKPRLQGDPNPGPGDWELILGTPLFLEFTFGRNGDWCRDVSIVPEAIEGAADAIAPSRDWCGSSQKSCAGTSFDERLPLEDELSTDHDDIESSWKHYLELARSATEHADALGQEYVQAAQQSDIRDEELDLRRLAQQEKAIGELQRVQEICGSSADPDALLDLLSLNPDGDLDLSNAGVLQGDLQTFINTHPEIGSLHTCLASFSAFQQTHLGDGFLCVANKIDPMTQQPPVFAPGEPLVRAVNHCKDDSGGPEPGDPVVADDDDVGPDTGCEDPNPAFSSNPRYHCVPGYDGLQMFDTDSLLPDPPLPGLCDGIRQLRATPVAGNQDRARLLAALTEHGVFLPEAGKNLSPSVSALGRPDVTFDTSLAFPSVVTVQIGPKRFSSSRQPAFCMDPNTTCLCGNTNTTCPAGQSGLLCRKWNCADPNALAELNFRLYKAGAAWPSGPNRIDTLWYVNHYVQPIGPWGGTNGANPWRLFGATDSSGGTQATFFNITSGVGFTIGRNGGLAQNFNVIGPLPTFPDNSTNTNNGANNHTMRFGFRNGFGGFVNDKLRFDLLDRATVPTEAAGSITLSPPHSGEVGRCGLGSIDVRGSGSLDIGDGVANLNPRFTGSGASLVTDRLKAIDLSFWGHNLAGTEQAAPASLRAGTSECTIVGTQVFPPTTPKTPLPALGLNPIPEKVTRFNVDAEARLDTLELACDILMKQDIETGCDVNVNVQTLDDFEPLGKQLECIGNQITRRAVTSVYNLPQDAIQYLRNGERIFDATGGSLAVTISDLRNSLLEAAISGPIVGGTLRRFGQDIRAVRAQLKQFGIQGEINKVKLKSEIANQITSCVTAAASAGNGPNPYAGAAAAVATCANSIAQIGFAVQIEDLQGELLKLDGEKALADFSGRTSDYVQTLETQSIRLSQALESIQRNLDQIEGLRREGLRSMRSAIWMLSQQASNQHEISRALDNIRIGKGIRYEHAFEDAKKMAWLAKRAIEMRLGMSLSDMVEDLPLVTAPASWEATVCETTGIDYAALRRDTGLGENFADSFLGDYVTKLEQVVESYRLVNNFHEGKDTAVVSLRDDIQNTRAFCNTESPNRLYWASRIDPLIFRPGESPNGWTLTGCVMESAEDDLGPFERPAGNCIITRQRSDSPFFDPLTGELPVLSYDVEFGLPDWCGPSCAYQNGAALSQQVLLEPGRYRFSWYTLDNDGGGGVQAMHIRHANGDPFTFVSDGLDQFIEGMNGSWNRVFRRFDVTETEAVTISFERPSPTDFSVPLAAMMLERLDDPFHTKTGSTPPSFMDTTDELTAFLPVCEDTTGGTFRAKKWDRNCLKLCPDGYASNCGENARTECFWETSFHVSQRSIEAGHIFNQSGFARGNFNYRIRSMGLNFVGTDLRACEDSNLPSTCNAAGFIPYSIIHDGPYYVRNHKGQDYRLALFPGHIEHARGLGIERYLTNPVGDADRSLIEPYMRSEFSGRPLDGDFIIRVWDEPGVNFDALQDIQIIIDYGYWTRFN